MNYFTQYTLAVRNLKDKAQFEKLEEELERRGLIGYAFDKGEYPFEQGCLNKYGEASFYPYDEVKWYDHAKDMIQISELYPEAYFELAGAGEDFGDFWREYYHDGECEYCRGEIVYEQPKKVMWDKLLVNF